MAWRDDDRAYKAGELRVLAADLIDSLSVLCYNYFVAYMSSFESSQGDQAGFEAPQAILLAGEGVAALTDEHRELLRQVASALAGGLTVELAVTLDLQSVSHMLGVHDRAEQPPEFAPATKDDFRQFAEEYGYTDQRATRTWTAVLFTAARSQPASEDYGRYDPRPAIRIVDPEPNDYSGPRRPDNRVLDLRSVYERLVADRPMQRSAWDSRMTLPNLGFLAHIVNESVSPVDPLPIDPRDFPPQRS